MNNKKKKPFVLAVEIAAQLHHVLKDARDISLQAMNAQSMITRAGDRSRSMAPIVNFMNDLSTSIVDLVEKIDNEALQISRTSLSEFREGVAIDLFEQARQLAMDTDQASVVQSLLDGQKETLNKTQQTLGKQVGLLVELLSSIETTLLSVNIVTSTFRVEVGNLNSEFRETFESLIELFEAATKNIRSVVTECRAELNAANLNI